MKYLFKTTCWMKDYNKNKYWIDNISNLEIITDNVTDALKEYQNIIIKRDGVKISDNALKTKQPLFRKDKQIGYVITASVAIENTLQYIDLWVEIGTLIETEF